MQHDKYTFLPSFAIEPGRCSSFNRVFVNSNCAQTYEAAQELQEKRANRPKSLAAFNKVTRSHHNFKISDNAYRTLKKKINWLYYLAKPRQIKTYSGKQIFNFKIAFVTFTLPSKQRAPTKEVTNKLFNQLLTEIRTRTDMQNYVWRLEFQKNKNVHYHLVTDTFLDYFFVQKIWNRILNTAGYIAPYQEKFSKMSLLQYNTYVNSKKKIDFSIIKKRYAKGVANHWKQPNSVDVKSVISKKKISNYIAKYFAKSPEGDSVCNEHDTKENSESLRLWFCSRSLSKLKSVTNFCEAVQYDIFHVIKRCKEVREVLCKYAKMYFFEISRFAEKERTFINRLLGNYARSLNYQPSG